MTRNKIHSVSIALCVTSVTSGEQYSIGSCTCCNNIIHPFLINHQVSIEINRQFKQSLAICKDVLPPANEVLC